MARIVTLGPVSNTSVTFEEAFGEYSNAQGKGRAKRKKRKLERIENRREVKKARTEARDEVKGERQDARISRRERRKSGRQAIRTEQSEARQGRRTGRQAERQVRRTARTESRVGRKALRKGTPEDLEQGLDTATPQEMGGAGESTGYTQPETSQTYADETQGQGSTSSPEGGYEGGYESESSQGAYQGGGYDAGQEDGAPYTDEDNAPIETGGEGNYYSEEESQEPESGEGVYDEEGDYIGDESGYLNDYQASDDFNFDGVMGAEDRFNEMTGPKSINVDSDVQDIANKLAWNQELIKRLEDKRKVNPNMAQGISKQIIMRKKRMKDLQQELDDFSNCCGEWSNADGSPETCAMRKQMVGRAWGIAKRNRQAKGKPVDVVRVQKSLDPKFSKNKIVVPRTSNAEGTGLNGLDLVDDFDAPRVREIYLGADGSKSGISWGSVIIGAAIGVGAIWAIKKYNLLK
jgi:hypothetical protein